MSVELGPKKFEKLCIGSRINDFIVCKKEPIVIVSTKQNQIKEFFIRDLENNKLKSHPLPMRTFQTNIQPGILAQSGKNILHCEDNLLFLNNRSFIEHKSQINQLITDDSEIALTSYEDNIFINSIANKSVIGELHNYGNTITALYWYNSLVISGDSLGTVNIWDINKQKILNSRQIHHQSIDYVNAYVDLIHTNLYYSVSKKQKKIIYSDLRTYKPLKTISDLPPLLNVEHSKTGKIFITATQHISFIDLYKGFHICGKFSPVSKFQRNFEQVGDNQIQNYQRDLTCSLIWDKYVIAGDSNGCIEIYDTDLLKYIFSFGVCEFSSVKRIKRLQNSLIVLQQKGLITVANLI